MAAVDRTPMNPEILTIVVFTAFPIGLLHTLFGPDHYVPFIALAKANCWSLKKTAWITLLCGIGHVLSAVILGIIGMAVGLSLTKITIIENVFAGILIVAVGLIIKLFNL